MEKFLNDGDLPMDLTRKMRKRRWMKRSPEKSSAIRGGFHKNPATPAPPWRLTNEIEAGSRRCIIYRSFNAEREMEKKEATKHIIKSNWKYNSISRIVLVV